MTPNRKGTRTFGALVLLSSSIVRLGGCLYLPAIPIIGTSLSISDSNMTSTVSLYFLVFAISSLIAGPFSDAFGRKPLIISGTLIFIMGSGLCLIAGTYHSLLSGRVLQAFGASMIPGTGRAMVREHCEDLQVVSLMGWLAVLGSVMFVGAPALGGILTSNFGWRSNFVFLSFFSFIVLILIVFFMPETLNKSLRTNLSLTGTLKNYFSMFAQPKFTMVILPFFLAFVFQGAYLGSASFIFIKEFHFSPEIFGYTNVILVAGLMLGRYIAVALAGNNGANKAFRLSAVFAPLAGLAFIAVIYIPLFKIIFFLSALFLFSVSIGIIMPLAIKISISVIKHRRGETASLQAFTALLGSAVGAFAVTLNMRFFHGLSAVACFSWIALAIALLIPISVVAGGKWLR